MVRAQTTSYAEFDNSELPKQTKSNKKPQQLPNHHLLSCPRCSRASTSGKGSEAKHLKYGSCSLLSNRPTQTHQGLPLALEDTGNQAASCSGNRIPQMWVQQRPVRVQCGGTGGSGQSLSWFPKEVQVLSGRGETPRPNTLTTARKSLCRHGYPAATRGKSHLSVPRKGKL